MNGHSIQPGKTMKFSSLPAKNSLLRASASTGMLKIGAARAKVLIIQNDLLCNPTDAIASFVAHDIDYHVIYAFYENAFKFQHPLMYEAMMVLGGRAGVYESPPWLEVEMKFVTNALKLKLPILGICLGCQLLAECIGGTVFPGKKGVEIGYKPWIWIKDRNWSSSSQQKPANHSSSGSDEHDKKESSSIPQEDSDAMSLAILGRAVSMPFVNAPKNIPNKKVNKKAKKDKALSPVSPRSSAMASSQKALLRMDFSEDHDDDDDDDFDEEAIDFDEDQLDVDLGDDDDDDEKDLDPIVAALKPKDLGRYVVLFHGDTFSLPAKCKLSGQSVQLLATTDKYNTLFRVGEFSYGFQGHPELNRDMLQVWCKCWGDDFLKKWPGDLDRDVVGFANKNVTQVQQTGRVIFDTWCSKAVLARSKQKLNDLTRLTRTRSLSNMTRITTDDNGLGLKSSVAEKNDDDTDPLLDKKMEEMRKKDQMKDKEQPELCIKFFNCFFSST